VFNADATGRRCCFQPGQNFGRNLDAQGHAARVEIAWTPQKARSAVPPISLGPSSQRTPARLSTSRAE
jgi:hypothetical protein